LEQWDGLANLEISTLAAPGSIWAPRDVVLYNSGEKAMINMREDMPAQVNSEGKVYWSRPGVMTSSYRPHMKDYPFDTETISWVFASWLYDTTQLTISIHPKGMDLPMDGDNYKSLSPEWEVLSKAAVIDRNTWVGVTYEEIIFSVTLRRHSHYYVAQVIVPGIILAMVSWFSFFMPRQVLPARTTLCMTTLLAQVTLRIVVNAQLPIQDTETWLEAFQTSLLYFNTAALFEWIIVIFISQMDLTCCMLRPHQPEDVEAAAITEHNPIQESQVAEDSGVGMAMDVEGTGYEVDAEHNLAQEPEAWFVQMVLSGSCKRHTAHQLYRCSTPEELQQRHDHLRKRLQARIDHAARFLYAAALLVVLVWQTDRVDGSTAVAKGFSEV